MGRPTCDMIDAIAWSKCDMHTIDISPFLHRLKEQLVKVSTLNRKPSFQNFEKNLFGDDIQYQSREDIATKDVNKNIISIRQKIHFISIFPQNENKYSVN